MDHETETPQSDKSIDLQSENSVEESIESEAGDVEFRDCSSAPQSSASALKADDVKDDSHIANSAVVLVAGFTLLSGLVATIHPLAARLEQHPRLFSILVTYDYYHWTKSLHVVFGLFLIFLSINLLKRKQNAWLATIILSIFSALLNIARIHTERVNFIPDPDMFIPYSALALPILTVVLLAFFRSQFTVKSETPRIRNGIGILALSVSLAVAYGTLGFWLLEPHDFGFNFQFVDALVHALREIFFIGNADLHAKSKFAVWFLDSLHIFGGLATAFAAYGLFRPIHYKLSTKPKERELADQLLNNYGLHALDHYKILADKSYFFLPGGKSFIAYKTVLNVAIGLGDPVGPPAEIESVTEEFRKLCRNNDWKLAFLQVTDKNLDMYKRLGLDVLKVGEEAIIELDKFAESTVKGKNFKSKVKKFDKDGFVLERCVPPHPAHLIDVVQSVSDAWLSLPGRRERGFSLGWFDRDELANEIIFVLKDPKGEIIAFVNQVKSYADGEASIDMMRHNEEVPNGTMDFLFTKLLLALKDDGYKTFNLGLAALSGVGEEPDAQLEERAVHEIYEHMNRFFSYKGLRRYKDKFAPRWEESFLVYQGGTPGLVKTALAVTRAGELDWDN